MIAVDSQPFSIVEDHGFSNLLKTIEPRYLLTSRKFFTENILPRIHTGVKLEVHSLLSSVSFFSFTTDIWSTSVSNDSLLSLTAHWLTDSSEKRSAVLHAEPFNESHIGENLCNKMNLLGGTPPCTCSSQF